jgi:hypothetical protein
MSPRIATPSPATMPSCTQRSHGPPSARDERASLAPDEVEHHVDTVVAWSNCSRSARSASSSRSSATAASSSVLRTRTRRALATTSGGARSVVVRDRGTARARRRSGPPRREELAKRWSIRAGTDTGSTSTDAASFQHAASPAPRPRGVEARIQLARAAPWRRQHADGEQRCAWLRACAPRAPCDAGGP